jgi:hypothetical protein
LRGIKDSFAGFGNLLERSDGGKWHDDRLIYLWIGRPASAALDVHVHRLLRTALDSKAKRGAIHRWVEKTCCGEVRLVRYLRERKDNELVILAETQ